MRNDLTGYALPPGQRFVDYRRPNLQEALLFSEPEQNWRYRIAAGPRVAHLQRVQAKARCGTPAPQDVRRLPDRAVA